ncbi:translocator protein homolog [Cucurbita maxima]|uniref:Translocator protein homolog n=1 Tax=Cucurbita maxima TaxID=3661 RepID=A0A6J1JZC9_CUCMA|nr:translocator protein homolog [Cucurbita maxima]
MASTELKHRTTGDSPAVPAAADEVSTKRAKNKAIAKRGLKSLAVAVSIPIAVTLLSILLLSKPKNYYPSATKPFWVPSARVVNWGSLASSLLMGISSWLFWAEGGFQAKPNALYLYTLYLVLCMAWYGLVLGAGSRWLGSVACLGKTATLVGCDRLFRGVNGIAADLVRPCLVWSVFLTIVSLTMVSV